MPDRRMRRPGGLRRASFARLRTGGKTAGGTKNKEKGLSKMWKLQAQAGRLVPLEPRYWERSETNRLSATRARL